MKSDKKRIGSRRGSALVELAFIFTVFTFMLIGVFDFSQFLFIHQSLVERARYACRWGVTSNPTNTTAIQNMVLYNESTAGTNGYFGLTSSMVQVSNPGSGTDDYRVVVFITNYPYVILSPYIGGTYSGPDITMSCPVGK